MGAHSCLANYVDCYSVGKAVLGEFATVSQQAMVRTETHDYNSSGFRLTLMAIGSDALIGVRRI
jgi:acetyltransferase-like isoleucine patch superfamily enzyme